MWLNVGCVLHLQVADSIPAQVSGSQSVLCVCVCCGYSSSSHPFLSLLPYSFLLFPLSEQPLLSSLWKRRHGYSNPPPFSSPLFILIACSALIFRVIKKPGLPSPSLISISTYGLAFCLPLYLNQTVTIAWKQHTVTS